MKIGSGLGTAAMGWNLGAGGFQSELATQSASALAAVTVSFAWVPALTAAISVVCMVFFDLDRHYDKVVAELAQGKYKDN